MSWPYWVLIGGSLTVAVAVLMIFATRVTPAHAGPSGDASRAGQGWAVTGAILAAVLALTSWIAVVPPGKSLPDDLASGGQALGSLPPGVTLDESGQLIDPKTGKVLSEKELKALGLSANGSTSVAGSGLQGSTTRGVTTPGGTTTKGPVSIDCAKGQNGGATDTGVSATKIRLAANVVTSGTGSSFLADARKAMEAVKQSVNSKGGVCGRQLDLYTVNDNWDAARGRQNIEDFIQQGYFALPVVPSSEGLSAAIDAGIIEKAGIPVVGTDGMRKEQFDANGKASWVWSVALATVSQVRIMAKYAAGKGAKTMGIVYDRKYKFGVEGADAFDNYIDSKLGGVTLKAKVGIEPNQSSYPETAGFKQKCNPCDLVVFLLEPNTAATWITDAGEGGLGAKFTMGGQPLFNRNFGNLCPKQPKALCNNLMVWSGYNPALGANQNKPGIAKYMQDVRSIDPAIDVTNQFTEGAYLGMQTFVEAVKRCSPQGLTRACVKRTMDGLDFSSDLSPTLKWRPGDHFANTGARAYYMSYAQGNFQGFGDAGTGLVNDPTPGVVPN